MFEYFQFLPENNYYAVLLTIIKHFNAFIGTEYLAELLKILYATTHFPDQTI